MNPEANGTGNIEPETLDLSHWHVWQARTPAQPQKKATKVDCAPGNFLYQKDTWLQL
jgi:hypothetical protein